FQPQRVNAISERLESRAAGGRGEASRIGQQATIGIHTEAIKRLAILKLREAVIAAERFEPQKIYHYVSPAVGLQMLREPIRVRHHLALVHCPVVVVVAVPAHRRGRRHGGQPGWSLRVRSAGDKRQRRYERQGQPESGHRFHSSVAGQQGGGILHGEACGGGLRLEPWQRKAMIEWDSRLRL